MQSYFGIFKLFSASTKDSAVKVGGFYGGRFHASSFAVGIARAHAQVAAAVARQHGNGHHLNRSTYRLLEAFWAPGS